MLSLCVTLAEVDAISGSSGWVGAGLLGAVLSWLLLKHLPELTRQDRERTSEFNARMEVKDERIQDLVTGFNARLDGQRGEFSATLRDLVKSFREEAATERASCERHYATLADSMNVAFRTLGDQLGEHSRRNQQWLEVLKGELVKYTQVHEKASGK